VQQELLAGKHGMQKAPDRQFVVNDKDAGKVLRYTFYCHMASQKDLRGFQNLGGLIVI